MVTSKDYDETAFEEHEGISDYGLSVTYDEKEYFLLDPINPKPYPIGGLISEFANLEAPKIKDIIKSCSNLCEPATTDNMVSALMEFHDKLVDELEPVQAIMVITGFLETCKDWFEACRTNRVEEFKKAFGNDNNNSQVKEYIFEGSNYTDVGGDTVEQLLDTAYLAFSDIYTLITYAFYQIIQLEGHYNKEGHERVMDLITAMLSNQPDLQHIDFRIMGVEGGFSPVYTIKTPLSLLLFEIVHSIEKEVNFTKCANCNRIFVPEGRKDIKYCPYASPQKEGKTCRDIGAQISRQNKEKTDVFTREYRKVYGRLKMAKSRHPGNINYAKKFDTFVQETKDWKSKLRNGIATMEQFTEWITNY